MKAFVLAVLLAVLAVAVGHTDLREGRPNCATDIEMRVVNYRNLWDPTAYWQCQKRNTPAVLVRCKSGAYQDKLKRCVEWDDWEWEESVVAPPSIAL